MKTAFLLTFHFLFVIACSFSEAQDAPQTQRTDASIKSKINEVVLYRSSAWVTREIELSKTTAQNQVIIPNLPHQLDPDSIHALGEDPIRIRSVQTRHVVDRRVLTKAELDEIRSLRVDLKATTNQLAILESKQKILAEMTKFAGKAQSDDLNRGLLDTQNVTALATYTMEQTQQILTEQFQLKEKSKSISEALTRLERKSNGQSAKIQATVRFDGKPNNDSAKILLRYKVKNVGWEPRITLRGKSQDSKLLLKYDAIVDQRTDEKWENVKLTFSSSHDNNIPVSPILTSLPITTHEDQDSDPFSDGDPVDTGYEQEKSNARDRDLKLNQIAAQRQHREVTTEKSLQLHASDAFDSISFQTYSIEDPITVDSMMSNQLVNLVESEWEAESYFIAVPLLSSYAYRECLATNSTGMSFPGGEATVYMDDRLIGNMDLRPIAAGQKIMVGLGMEPQIRIRRELLSKSEKLNGGNRQLHFAYKLVVANFKQEKVNVRLFDRLPYAKDEQQISVQFNESLIPISKDPLYLRMQQPKGILRWDVEVPEKKFGAEAYDLKYNFNLEFDKNTVPVTDFSDDEIVAEYGKAKMRVQGGGGFGGGGFGGGGVFKE